MKTTRPVARRASGAVIAAIIGGSSAGSSSTQATGVRGLRSRRRVVGPAQRSSKPRSRRLEEPDVPKTLCQLLYGLRGEERVGIADLRGDACRGLVVSFPSPIDRPPDSVLIESLHFVGDIGPVRRRDALLHADIPGERQTFNEGFINHFGC